MSIFQAIGRRWRNRTYFGKNYEAAKRDFLRILEAQNLTSDLEQRTQSFTQGFEITYNSHQARLTDAVSIAKPRGDKRGVSDQVLNTLGNAVDFIEEYVSGNDPSKIGTGFGMLLAVAQYGIGSEYFDHEEYAEPTLKHYKNVEDAIHKIDKSIQLVNIATRIFEIDRETRSTGRHSPTTRLLNEIGIELSTSG